MAVLPGCCCVPCAPPALIVTQQRHCGCALTADCIRKSLGGLRWTTTASRATATSNYIFLLQNAPDRDQLRAESHRIAYVLRSPAFPAEGGEQPGGELLRYILCLGAQLRGGEFLFGG